MLVDAILDAMDKYPDSAAVVRHGLHALCTCIQAQEDAAWGSAQMTRSIQCLMTLAADPRPKIRKVAQNMLGNLISGEGGSKAAKSHLEGRTVHFCGQAFKACTSANLVTSQHLLGLAKDLAPSLSPKPSSHLIQHVTELLAIENNAMFAQVASTLAVILRQGDTSAVSSKTFGSILKNAMEREPMLGSAGNSNSEVQEAYVNFIAAILEKYTKVDEAACAEMVPAVFQSVSVYCSPSGSDTLPVAAADILCQLIDVFVPAETAKVSKSVREMISVTESLLLKKFQPNFHCTLPVAHSFFNRMRSASLPALNKVLEKMVTLVPWTTSLSGAAQEQLDAALGAAILYVGPEGLLKVCPIFDPSSGEISLSNKKNRTWLFPVLKKHVRGASLAFYCQNLLPAADALRNQAIQADEQGRPVEAKNFINISEQIWGLLPSFMTDCSDLPESLPGLAKRLGVTIESEPSLRMTCCAAIVAAVRSSRGALEHDDATGGGGDADMESESEEEGGGSSAEPRHQPRLSKEAGQANCTALSTYAKNFLPILFNVAAQTPVPQRPQVLDAIEAYVSITDQARISQFFTNVMKKLLSASAGEGDSAMDTDEEKEEKKILLVDLAMALMPGIDDASADFLYKAAIPLLRDSAVGVQKRSYKLIQSMGVHHTAMIQTRLGDLCEALVAALPETAPGASKWRLRCLHKLVELLPIDEAYMKLLGGILGEVMLGTKQAARKSRDVSFAMLVCMAQRIDDPSNGGHLNDFFSMILAGLAGTTPHMISASILALSRLVYEYSARVQDLAPQLLESIMILLEHKSREIITSALGFAKVISVSLPHDMLRRYLKPMVESLLLWSADSRNRFRLKVKVVLERLVRRLSYEEVLEATPVQHHALIQNIQKKIKRSKAKKKAGAAGDDEMGDYDEGAEAERGAKVKGGYEAALYGDEEVEEESDDEDGEEGGKRGGGGGHQYGAQGRRGLGSGMGVSAGGVGDGKGARAVPQNVGGFAASQDGRPVIVERMEEEDRVGGKKRRRQDEEAYSIVGDVDKEAKERLAEQEGMKEATAAHHGGLATQAAATQGKNSRSWDQAPTLKRRKKQQAPSKVLGMSEFAPKKNATGGDQQRPNRPDPFAYMAFDKRMLNKRKKHQPTRSLKGVFNASKNQAKSLKKKAGGRG